MAEHHIKIVQAAYQAFQKGDIPGILEYVADDIDWGTNVDPALPGAADVPYFASVKGKKNLPAWFGALAGAVDFTRFEPTAFTHGGDHVFVLVNITATVKKNGKKLEDRVIHAFTFNAQNKVAQFREFTDTALAIAAFR